MNDRDSTTSDEDDDEVGGSAPIMSIFASYYGIEESNIEANKQKGTIDDADFDANGYVRELLLEGSVESLVKKDTDMIHEIRTLDGEMQKLVYDNYNKFITATETIKEMKKDVYGMDGDMEEVRRKMGEISAVSTRLDAVFEEKRTQVDKLVRIRRLLQRLEFLSELPERLSAMIEARMYQDAVVLYNKTIDVLTRHSHVLSFKLIKERTVQMMAELTGQVIRMLDDKSLEANMLTHYVSVLRLMSAPGAEVAARSLAAHRARAMSLIDTFGKQFTRMINSGTGGSELGSQAVISLDLSTPLSEISNARKFHQNLLVELIESCKGVYELYSPDVAAPGGMTSPRSAAAAAGGARPSKKQLRNEARKAHGDLQRMIGDVMVAYSKWLEKAYSRFFARYHSFFCDRLVDYGVLAAEEADDMSARHSATLSSGPRGSVASASGADRRSSVASKRSSLGASFDGDEDGSSQHSSDDKEEVGQKSEVEEPATSAKLVSSVASPRTLATAAGNAASVEELQLCGEMADELAAWTTLSRQAINDVKYLDGLQRDSFVRCPAGHAAGDEDEDEDELDLDDEDDIQSHCSSFADMLLRLLNSHVDVLMTHRVNCFLHMAAHSSPAVLSQCIAALRGSGSNSSGGGGLMAVSGAEAAPVTITRPTLGHRPSMGSDSAGAANGGEISAAAARARALIAKKTATVKDCFEDVLTALGSVFSDVCRDIKPVVDVYEAADRDVENFLECMLKKFCFKLADRWEAICGVTNHVCSFNDSTGVLSLLGIEGGAIATSVANEADLLGLGLSATNGPTFDFDGDEAQTEVTGGDGDSSVRRGGSTPGDRRTSSSAMLDDKSSSEDEDGWSKMPGPSRVAKMSNIDVDIYSEQPVRLLENKEGAAAAASAGGAGRRSSTNSAASSHAAAVANSAAGHVNQSGDAFQLASTSSVLRPAADFLEKLKKVNFDYSAATEEDAADVGAAANPFGSEDGDARGGSSGNKSSNSRGGGSAVVNLHAMWFASFLRYSMPTLFSRLQIELEGVELPTVETSEELKEHINSRLELCGTLLVKQFVESNARKSVQMLSKAQRDIFVSNYEDLRSEDSTASSADRVSSAGALTVCDSVLDYAKYLDELCVTSCVLLQEPPQPYRATTAAFVGDRARTAHRSTVAGHNLQLDIDRLFAEKVIVFPHETLSLSALSSQSVVNVALKSALKMCQEDARSYTLSTRAYAELQACVSFIKHVSSTLLKESRECENLAEQLGTAIFSRYIGANDVSNATDSREAALVQKAVTQAFSKVLHQSALLQRLA